MSRILLVDDDPLLVRMYQKKFENDGYQIDTAGDGEEVSSKVAKVKPDLILMDIMMPKVNGIDALRKLKSSDSTKDIPVVLLTNVSGPMKDIDEGLALGAVGYLVKANYTPREIVQKVKEILEAYTHNLPEVKVKIKE